MKLSLQENMYGCIALSILNRSQTNQRKGYMGHLTNVANSLVQSLEKGKNKAALDTIFAGMSFTQFSTPCVEFINNYIRLT